MLRTLNPKKSHNQKLKHKQKLKMDNQVIYIVRDEKKSDG